LERQPSFASAEENLWFARLLASVFWVVGGIFLYLIGLRVTAREGTFVGLALYLFWPYGARVLDRALRAVALRVASIARLGRPL
jgi:hypothetical protein